MTRLRALISRGILLTAIILSFLLGSSSSRGMGSVVPLAQAGELYAGIELSTEGIRAVALRISRSEEEPGLELVYSEVIHLSLGRDSSGKFIPQAYSEAAQGISRLLAQLRQQHKVPLERIYLIGSSELGADHQEDLISTIKRLTGKTLTFMDSETEGQLSIVGTISRRGKVGLTWIDYRDSSMLIKIGNYSTKGGYQLLRYVPSVYYDFVTMNIPYGTVSFTNEVSRGAGEFGDLLTLIQQAKIVGAGAVREALRKECESKPGLLNRKRVYLTGDIAWAMATMLYPEDRQPFVTITPQDIALFASKVARDPNSLLNPNLSRIINDRDLRQEVEKEFAAIKKTFSVQQLIAGAELLRVISVELNWQEKNIRFARFGNLGCILSYVRVQAGK